MTIQTKDSAGNRASVTSLVFILKRIAMAFSRRGEWDRFLRSHAFITSLSLAAILSLSPGRANAADIVRGFNLVHPEQLSAADQDAGLAHMKAAGVSVIRLGFVGDTDKGLDFIKRVYAQNLKIVLIVHQQYVPNAKIRPYQAKEFPGMWEGPPLSAGDTERSGQYFQKLMDQLDSGGIALAGLELENEINTSAFNPEFPLPGEGKNFGLDDLNHDPEAQQIAKGYLQYLKVLTVLRQIRDHSRLNQHTPLISAGLADTGAEGKWQKRIDAVSVSATIKFFRANGIDKIVDGYGVHTYPWADGPGEKASAVHRLRRLQQETLPECYPAGSSNGKPCWLTEWGFANDSKACPSDERARSQLVQEMMNDFRQPVRERRLQAVIYYSWSGEPAFDIYRCGGLTESGKIAAQPL